MKVVIAGGSGALGRRLSADLTRRGHEVVVLTRSPNPGAKPARHVGWDGRTVGRWAAELEGSAVVNLAGELVDRPPTARNIELPTLAALRRVVRRPAAPPTPALLVRLGALLLRTDPALALALALALTGRRAIPRRLLDAGFTFDQPDLRIVLEDLVKEGA